MDPIAETTVEPSNVNSASTSQINALRSAKVSKNLELILIFIVNKKGSSLTQFFQIEWLYF
jgi:hypothetical protein